MLKEEEIPYVIDLSAWVEKAKSDSLKYRIRQVVEILMYAIGSTKHLKENMYLKGGTLMAIAHNSERMTGDVDYSWFGEPFALSIADEIKESLDVALKRAATKLGYLDLVCKIQSIKKEPRKWENVSYPALCVSIGYASIGTPQERALANNKASNVVRLDISFNEPLENAQKLLLDSSDVTINAYAPTEIIAEKMRALMQQTQRLHERSRRQDVYDIALLINKFMFDAEEKKIILGTLHIKANAREVSINKDSFADGAVRSAAEKEWGTMALEIEEPLPSFDACYKIVQDFYESLPW